MSVKRSKEEPFNFLKKRQLAQERWNILAQTLNGFRTSETQQCAASMRRFQTYSLLQSKKAVFQGQTDDPEAAWYIYLCQDFPGWSVMIRHRSETVKASDLLGFNNTGNICIWPSEEVMTHYCLHHLDEFKDASVIELGGGMTCLAGVAVATASEASQVVITDGNEQSVKNLQYIIQENKFNSTAVSARILRWSPENVQEDLKNAFDIVLCADCLFFDDGREHLVHTINSLLKPGGLAWIFAPSRNSTFDKFCDLAKEFFLLEKLENYSDRIWSLHLQMKAAKDFYDENIHYPLFVRLTKHPSLSSRDVTPESR